MASDPARLAVYHRSLTMVRELEQLARRIPSEHRHLKDQLRRASTSVSLNLAEGAGEFSPAEKARFYRMARRSASECIGVLDILPNIGSHIDVGSEREHLDHLVAVISRLILATDRRA